MKSNQQSLQIWNLKYQLNVVDLSQSLCVSPRLSVLREAVFVQQNKSLAIFPGVRLPFEITHRVCDDRQRITAVSGFDLKVDPNACVCATSLDELCEASFAQPFGTHENGPPGIDPDTAPHLTSTQIRDAAEYTCSILGIQTGVTT